VAWVLIIIKVYSRKAATFIKVKYLTRNTIKNGNMHTAISQLINDIQFFFVLKILMREKASA
jgi:hypothetical protein